MFSKTRDSNANQQASDSQQQQRRTQARVAAPSIICADMTVIGTITCSGDIQIDGKIEGDIYSTCLTVGEKAVITGEIRSDEVVIRGHVVGGIRARKVNLAATCHVEGDITHNALAVETGAFFQGNIRHADDALPDAMSDASDVLANRSQGTAQQSGLNGAGAPAHEPSRTNGFAAPDSAPAQAAAQAPSGMQPNGHAGAPQPAAPQGARPQPAAPMPRNRQTFPQFNPNQQGGPSANGANGAAPQGNEGNDALNAALQKLNAQATGPGQAPRGPAQPRPGQPGGTPPFPPRTGNS